MQTAPSLAFGTLLRRYRIAAGLTQEELAERAGISLRNLGDMERGVARTPRKATVALLTAALTLSPPDRAALEDATRRLGSALASVPRPAMPSAPPLVGRARELSLIERHLWGEGPPLLLLAGEPGIGKTRLLHAAIPRAVAQGWCVLQGGCQRRGGHEPYAPLLGALQRHLHSRSRTQQRRELAGCAWLVRLLPELAQGPIEPLPAWTLPPEQERRLMGAAVGHFLGNVAGPAGTLLLLDDLQWAGADALDLLTILARQGAEMPLRVMCAYRDTEVRPADPLATLLADLAHAGLAVQHILGPLTPADAEHLLAGLLVDVPSAGPALPQVMQRAGGNPFFLVSYARGLQAGVAAAIPWDLTQSLRQRLAVLPPGAHQVLGVTALIGRVVERRLLAAVVAGAEDDLLAALDAACAAQLLREAGSDTYQFMHDVIREVVEADLSAARRGVLHRRVAEALERQPGAPVEAVAYHYAHTDQHAAAAAWLERAGDQAVSTLAQVAALEYYRTARDRAEAGGMEPAVRSRLDEKAGDLHLLRLELGPALAAFARARTEEPEAGRRADLWRKEGVVHSRLGDIPAALAAFAVAEGQDAGSVAVPPVVRAAVHADRAAVYYFLGDFVAAEAEAEEAMALLGRGTASPASARVLASAAWMQAIVRDIQGDVEGARRSAQYLLTHAERIGDQQFIGRALVCLGIFAWRESRFDEAEGHVQAAQLALDRVGDEEWKGGCSWTLSRVALARGDLSSATAHLQRMCDILGPSAYFVCLAYEDLGRLACAQGALQTAESWVRRSLGPREQIGDQRGLAQSWAVLGTILLERGDHAGAVYWYRRARRLAQRCSVFYTELEGTIGHARACLQAAGPVSRARLRLIHALLAQGQRLVARQPLREAVIDVALLDAEVHMVQRLPSIAKRAAQEALQLAEEAGLHRQVATARRLLGRCDLALGEPADAERYLRSALALLNELGFALDAAHARVELAEALRARAANTDRSQEIASLLTEAATQFASSGVAVDELGRPYRQSPTASLDPTAAGAAAPRSDSGCDAPPRGGQ